MAKFTYSITNDGSSGYAWEEAYLNLKVCRVDSDETQTHVATYELRWPEATTPGTGDHTHAMSVKTLFCSQSEMRGTFDLELMAHALKALGDAFTEDHELYDEVFYDAEGEPCDLRVEFDNGVPDAIAA